MPKSLVRNFKTYAAAEKAVNKAGYSEERGGNPITTGVWFYHKDNTGKVKKVAVIFRASASIYKALYYTV
jgi:hypothetical protein